MAAPLVPGETPSMIVVMGVTGAGKSYFINQLAGGKAVEEGPTLESCTQECQLVPCQIGRTRVLLIDTPGFDDAKRTDADILLEIARILSAQYQLGVQLKGVIYIHRISDMKYTRSAVKTFEIFKKICGKQAVDNVLLVTSRWAEVKPSVGSDRERQLKENFWAYMIARGSHMSRFHGDRDSAISLVSQLLCKESIILGLQHELVNQGKRLEETEAGSFVNGNVEKLKAKYESELTSLERLKADLLANDLEMKRQIQRDWEIERARLYQAQQQQVQLNSPVAAQVQQQIAKKKSGLSKVLPFLPFVINILLTFVGIPPGLGDVLTGWIGDLD